MKQYRTVNLKSCSILLRICTVLIIHLLAFHSLGRWSTISTRLTLWAHVTKNDITAHAFIASYASQSTRSDVAFFSFGSSWTWYSPIRENNSTISTMFLSKTYLNLFNQLEKSQKSQSCDRISPSQFLNLNSFIFSEWSFEVVRRKKRIKCLLPISGPSRIALVSKFTKFTTIAIGTNFTPQNVSTWIASFTFNTSDAIKTRFTYRQNI